MFFYSVVFYVVEKFNNEKSKKNLLRNNEK